MAFFSQVPRSGFKTHKGFTNRKTNTCYENNNKLVGFKV